MKKLLPIDQIEVLHRVRYRVDQATVEDYASAIKNGAEMPAIDVFVEKGSKRYVLADGEHRLLAHEKAGKKKIACEMHEGDEKEALHFALQANAEHGLRRTNADKRKAVLLALNEPMYDEWPLRDLADLCHCSHEFVRSIKQEINEKADQYDKAEKKKAEKKKKGEDESPARQPLTQGEKDRDEFRAALKLIRTFPYGGAERPEDFVVSAEDIEHVELAIHWLMKLYEAETGMEYGRD